MEFLGDTVLGLWIALSGHYTILLIVAGVITAILCVAISIRMDLIDRLHPSISLSYRLPLFWLWLALEFFKSGLPYKISFPLKSVTSPPA